MSEFPPKIWLAHIKQIADYLVYDEGVWFQKEGSRIIFHDGEDEPSFRDEGPPLLDFVDTKIYEVGNYFCIKTITIT